MTAGVLVEITFFWDTLEFGDVYFSDAISRNRRWKEVKNYKPIYK